MTDADTVYENRRIFLAGYVACLEQYAIWKDGGRYAGVRQRRLKDVIDEVRSGQDDMVNAAMRLAFE